MKTIPTLLFLATLPFSLHAQDSAPGRMSGARIVKQWVAPSPQGASTPSQLLERQFADGYLAGVADATHGTVWCNKSLTKTHEIDAEVMWTLKELPTQELHTGVAAKLVMQALAKHFPCDRRAK